MRKRILEDVVVLNDITEKRVKANRKFYNKLTNGE